MERHLKQLPPEILDLIYLARDTAAAMGLNCYLIGGFVRDLVMSEKNLDLDIAVEGDGIAFADMLAEKLSAKVTRHKRFGTATVMMKHHLKIDIASTRKEFYPEPACLPIVNKGSLKDDLYRRDFTINTLAIDLSPANFARLLDNFNAKRDIKAKKIRILHERSFIDDPTRILRAIRFEQRFSFHIEPVTLKCLLEAVRLNMLSIVQPQRTRDEIILLLKEKSPLKQISRLNALVGLDFIDPHIKFSSKTRSLFESVHKEIAWFKKVFDSHRQIEGWLLYFMALVDGLSPERVDHICRKFVFKKGEEKRIHGYMRGFAKIEEKLRVKKLKPSTIFHVLEPLSYEVILMARARSKNGTVKRHIEDFLRDYNKTKIDVSGKDLIGMGIVPGPHYQKILHQVLNAKLDGQLRDKKQELEFARKIKDLR